MAPPRSTMAVAALSALLSWATAAGGQTAAVSGTASGQGSAGSGGMCVGCDPYYYCTTWWWDLTASGGIGGALDVRHDALWFGRFGPNIGVGDGDWAFMLEADYDISDQSRAAFGGGLWAIYRGGTFWVDGGGLVDLDGVKAHGGARLAVGWAIFGVEAQAREYSAATTGLGDVIALYGMVKVPYGLAAQLLHLPALPGGGSL